MRAKKPQKPTPNPPLKGKQHQARSCTNWKNRRFLKTILGRDLKKVHNVFLLFIVKVFLHLLFCVSRHLVKLIDYFRTFLGMFTDENQEDAMLWISSTMNAKSSLYCGNKSIQFWLPDLDRTAIILWMILL